MQGRAGQKTTKTNNPCTALDSWQLHLGLCGGYGEWYIWIPHEKLGCAISLQAQVQAKLFWFNSTFDF